MLKSYPLGPVNVVFFGNRVLEDVIDVIEAGPDSI